MMACTALKVQYQGKNARALFQPDTWPARRVFWNWRMFSSARTLANDNITYAHFCSWKNRSQFTFVAIFVEPTCNWNLEQMHGFGRTCYEADLCHFKQRVPMHKITHFKFLRQYHVVISNSSLCSHRSLFLLSNYVASASARSRRILLTPYYRTRRKHVAKARTGHPNLLTRIPKI
jgi:hypothetical protein